MHLGQALFLPLGLAVVGLPHPDSTFPRGGGGPGWWRPPVQAHLTGGGGGGISYNECVFISCHAALLPARGQNGKKGTSSALGTSGVWWSSSKGLGLAFLNFDVVEVQIRAKIGGGGIWFSCL